MNPLKKAYCRVFQFAFHAVLPVLHYREPVILDSVRHLPRLLQEQNKRLRLQSLLTGGVVILLLVLLMMLAAAATAVGPKLEKTLTQMEKLSQDIAVISQQLDDPEMMENLKEAIESIQTVATNLESISQQFVGMDLRGQIEDLSEVVKTTGEALAGAADEIANLDLAGVQKAIDNLQSILATLSALTSIGRQ